VDNNLNPVSIHNFGIEYPGALQQLHYETHKSLEEMYRKYVDPDVKDDGSVLIMPFDAYTHSFMSYLKARKYETKEIIPQNWMVFTNATYHDYYLKQRREMKKLGIIDDLDFFSMRGVVFNMDGVKGLFYEHTSRTYFMGSQNTGCVSYVLIDRKDLDKFYDFLPDLTTYSEERNQKEIDYRASKIKPFTWDNLILEKKMKEDIINNFENFFESKPFYQENNLPYKRGYIFVGPPGNGKSLCTSILCSQYKNRINTCSLDPDSNPNDIRNVYGQKRYPKTIVVLIEEIDKLTLDGRMRGVLLDAIDGNTNKSFYDNDCGIITIATANEPENISKAFTKRPSRFDRVWRFNNPTLEAKVEYFDMLSKNRYDKDKIREAFGDTEVFSMAAVKEVYIDSHMGLARVKKLPGISQIKQSVARIKSQFKQGDNNFEEVKNVGFLKSSRDFDFVDEDDICEKTAPCEPSLDEIDLLVKEFSEGIPCLEKGDKEEWES
jgi:MoxR-like ATPase